MVNKHPIVIAALILTLFAIAGSGLVAFTYSKTADRIAQNEREALLRQLHALVPANTIDNDILQDTITIQAAELMGKEKTLVYLGRKGGKPIAAVFTPIVPDGYGGPIKLLVAVNTDGSLGGVRVVSHKETPGLGDKVEERKSDWIYSFDGKSLGNPTPDKWKVKRDGGYFDQFTGATITPRSIVKAVKNTLLWYRDQGKILFQTSESSRKKQLQSILDIHHRAHTTAGTQELEQRMEQLPRERGENEKTGPSRRKSPRVIRAAKTAFYSLNIRKPLCSL